VELAETIDDEALRAQFRVRASAHIPPPATNGPRPGPGAGLSPREVEVLRLLVEGRSDREIAAALAISPRTVMRHVAGILNKLGVSSRTAAATIAIRTDLV
jgi:DNA-binding NarL/FixJ family response regulator